MQCAVLKKYVCKYVKLTLVCFNPRFFKPANRRLTAERILTWILILNMSNHYQIGLVKGILWNISVTCNQIK